MPEAATRDPMRLSATILSVIAFLLAGVVAVLAARVAVGSVEERSVAAVQEEIVMQGHDWATVLGDGLQVIIQGEAPTEAARFRAMSIAGGIVDASRVIDNIRVTDTAGIAAPEFAIEILRNDSGVSLIGLIPANSDRLALSEGIARIAGGAPVTDLLQSADYPVPETWRPALDFALEALERLPRSKISVSAGTVAVIAISDSLAEQRRIESDLARRVPDGVRLALNVSAPRPVISPFTTRLTIDDRGTRFDACSADTEADRDMILSAARAAGAVGQLDCRLGLGVPSPSWGRAVSQGIAALAEIGGGTITFSNVDVVLVAAEGTDPDVFDRVAGRLSNTLPDVFSLESVRPSSSDAGVAGPPQFAATLSPEGQAQMRGRVHDPLMNATVANFARAQFGADKVIMSTRVAPDGLPPGWSVRVLAAIEALSMLSDGTVTVLPDSVEVTGQTGIPTARDDITRLFIDKLGRDARFRIDVTYVEALDPLAGLPTPEECVAAIRAVTEGRKITFEPGSATLNADAMPIIDDIAEVLRLCGDLRLRIAGFTDSQGREETNLRLSQQRAEAVLEALRMRRVPVGKFDAVGYGAANPIADNGTEAGREANRRIEFSLIGAEGSETPTPDSAVVPPETRPRARPVERPEMPAAGQSAAAQADDVAAVPPEPSENLPAEPASADAAPAAPGPAGSAPPGEDPGAAGPQDSAPAAAGPITNLPVDASPADTAAVTETAAANAGASQSAAPAGDQAGADEASGFANAMETAPGTRPQPRPAEADE